jgi:hypothetical protein
MVGHFLCLHPSIQSNDRGPVLPGCAPHLHPFPPIFPPLDYGSFPSGSAETPGLRRMTFISFLRLEIHTVLNLLEK